MSTNITNKNFESICDIIKSVTEDEFDLIANLSNISAILFELIDDINWVGFYRLDENDLVLGPFQGKLACTRIKIGNGVCGTCAKNDTVIRVDNVHLFPGHIACDSQSNSEIVCPIHDKKGNIIYLLDIDSTSYSRFESIENDIIKISKTIENVINSKS